MTRAVPPHSQSDAQIGHRAERLWGNIGFLRMDALATQLQHPAAVARS